MVPLLVRLWRRRVAQGYFAKAGEKASAMEHMDEALKRALNTPPRKRKDEPKPGRKRTIRRDK